MRAHAANMLVLTVTALTAASGHPGQGHNSPCLQAGVTTQTHDEQ